ncbi:CHAT domain-containing tetratricopeptide repeat protein [uncultured Hyphomicrobium sp.]|uniref:CHAT domain-containing tetratricopeptide repeat protein n=1 Tax=uncultured Hyphomicrobium sp. TaxID=194373 RepID=UPI0025E50440|nr:CHAT domain-containing tetratricopeptide repeat protein [uncultured Hyphomicrobium sp.]
MTCGRPARAQVQRDLRAALLATIIATVLATVSSAQDGADLSTLYQQVIGCLRAGRFAECVPKGERALKLAEQQLGPDSTDTATFANNLAELYTGAGRYSDAEPLYKRALQSYEAALGPDHMAVGSVLNNLGNLYQGLGRFPDAEAVYRRSLSIREKNLGPGHPELRQSLNNLASLYESTGRFEEAVSAFERSLAIGQATGTSEDYEGAITVEKLALLANRLGRKEAAEKLMRRAIELLEKILGSEHPDVATLIANLGTLYLGQGRCAEAAPLYERDRAITYAILGKEHPRLATTLGNMGSCDYLQRNWSAAAAKLAEATRIVITNLRRELGSGGNSDDDSLRAQSQGQFVARVRALRRFFESTGAADSLPAAFEMAQWAQSSRAGRAVAQMAARSAVTSPELAGRVRERQDLVGEWRTKDKILISARTQGADSRNAAAEKALADRLAAIDSRIAEIDARLATDFPDYASLTNLEPLAVADVQSLLRDDEALLLFLDTGAVKFDSPDVAPLPEESFIWVVTKSEARWTRSDLGSESLEREVTALRCGLDDGAWAGEGLAKCNTELARDAKSSRPETLPFDHARSFRLYTALLGEASDLIKGKQLLVVPSGPLTRLPFQVLVAAAPPAGADGGKIAWLVRDHAITVLPAVASLQALRASAGASTGRKFMIAFANPGLEGDPKNGQDVLDASIAAYHQRCGLPRSPEEDLREKIRMAGLGVEETVAEIKRFKPVPGTAKLVCDIAADPAFANSEVLLGRAATEAALRNLSTSGGLADFRVVQFATHGVTAGQVVDQSEPGLILTPPAKPESEANDGYLSASEVTELKLDADWVILSACNTAAGSGGDGKSDATTTGESLSGLARAFIYAQARGLIVSHWSVREEAAVALVTSAMRRVGKGDVSGAQALQGAMLELADSTDPGRAHPSYWAPFFVVGGGGASARSPGP